MAVTQIIQNLASRSSVGTPVPAYFISLAVRNFRCFGPDIQTLNIADAQGCPARWTVLIGENGVGKTTLLQLLAGFQAGKEAVFSMKHFPLLNSDHYQAFFGDWALGEFTGHRRFESRYAVAPLHTRPNDIYSNVAESRGDSISFEAGLWTSLS